jgi:hypothetical protein
VGREGARRLQFGRSRSLIGGSRLKLCAFRFPTINIIVLCVAPMKAIMIGSGRQNVVDVAVFHGQRYRVSGERQPCYVIA